VFLPNLFKQAASLFFFKQSVTPHLRLVGIAGKFALTLGHFVIGNVQVELEVHGAFVAGGFVGLGGAFVAGGFAGGAFVGLGRLVGWLAFVGVRFPGLGFPGTGLFDGTRARGGGRGTGGLGVGPCPGGGGSGGDRVG